MSLSITFEPSFSISIATLPLGELFFKFSVRSTIEDISNPPVGFFWLAIMMLSINSSYKISLAILLINSACSVSYTAPKGYAFDVYPPDFFNKSLIDSPSAIRYLPGLKIAPSILTSLNECFLIKILSLSFD